MNNEIVNFYVDIAHDSMPCISDVLDGGYNFIETTHNWCQRAFPNFEPSEVVQSAPVLDEPTLEWLKRMQMENVYKLVFRYMAHYTSIFEPSQLPHNNRRVTRLIKYLVMLECPTYVVHTVFATCWKHFQSVMLAMGATNEQLLSTLMFWNDAVDYKRENNESSTTNSAS